MKKITVVFFVAALIISAAFNYGLAQGESITKSVLRLHIPANSNSYYDQSVKLKIRDRILKKYGGLLDSVKAVDEAEDIILKNLSNIENDVNLWLMELGADYKASVFITYSDFPTRKYESISLPAGNYKALKIVLGTGEGENWWCVMFPPVCFVDGGVKHVNKKEYEMLKQQLGKSAFEVVTSDQSHILLKFKIVEIVNNIIG